MISTAEDGNGNVVEQTVDNGDGTATRTVYDEHGKVVTAETVTIPPPPPPTVAQATEALVALTAESTLIAAADRIPVGTADVFAPLLPAWQADQAVTVGALRVDGATVWQAVQAHTTQADWAPERTPALWRRWRDPDAGPAPWVQPTGSSDAYAKGARVTHKGSVWESLVAANVWEPTAGAPTLWKEIK